jgi:hypothetical protein
MDDDGGLEGFNQFQNAGAIANVQFVMRKAGQCPPQALLVPAGIALRTEEGLALVIVHAVDGQPLPVEEAGDFGPDQAGGAGYKTVLTHAALSFD